MSKPSETMTHSIIASRIFIFCQSNENELVIEKELENKELIWKWQKKGKRIR